METNILEKIALSITSTLVSIVLAYITGTILHNISLLLLIKAGWIVIVALIVFGALASIVISLLYFVLPLINMPLLYFGRITKTALIGPTIVYLWFCFSNVMEVWDFPIEYNWLTIACTVLIDINIISIYSGLLSNLWDSKIGIDD